MKRRHAGQVVANASFGRLDGRGRPCRLVILSVKAAAAHEQIEIGLRGAAFPEAAGKQFAAPEDLAFIAVLQFAQPEITGRRFGGRGQDGFRDDPRLRRDAQPLQPGAVPRPGDGVALAPADRQARIGEGCTVSCREFDGPPDPLVGPAGRAFDPFEVQKGAADNEAFAEQHGADKGGRRPWRRAACRHATVNRSEEAWQVRRPLRHGTPLRFPSPRQYA